MEQLNSYLLSTASQLIIPLDKKDRIEESFSILKAKVWAIFQETLSNVQVFGSFDRDTIISKDADMDVDVLITFKENQFKPQTYLDKLKNFGEKNYPRSEIYPDHPTIVIEMAHIKFELVPSYLSAGILKIPAPRRKEIAWISTDPKSLRDKLVVKDKNNKELIVPVIRLLKYWNCLKGKIFESYEIEKAVIGRMYECKTVTDYFFSASNVFSELARTDEQKKAYAEMREFVRRIRVLEREKFSEYSLMEIQKLLPTPK